MIVGPYFNGVITVAENHGAMTALVAEFHGWAALGAHAFVTAPFWLAATGVGFAYYCYMVNPAVPAAIKARLSAIYTLLDNKYYFDRFNEFVFAGGARLLGNGLWKGGDMAFIDGVAINGSVRLVNFVSRATRLLQTGYLYQYAFVMIVAVLFSLTLFVFFGAGSPK